MELTIPWRTINKPRVETRRVVPPKEKTEVIEVTTALRQVEAALKSPETMPKTRVIYSEEA
jgi:hypothetical protein